MARTRLLCTVALVLSGAAAADGPTCSQGDLSLSRQLRQVYLDLIGRPPTIDEYRFIERKRAILPEDVRELMTREEFYTRMRQYHRALLRTNISGSVPTENFSRISTTTAGLQPLGLRGVASSSLRGQNNAGCDAFIEQDKCNDTRQDPLLEPAVKTCRDAYEVPLPVSVDYSSDQYDCQIVPGVGTCAEAVGRADLKGRTLPAKHQFFCDMRRVSTGVTLPHYCVPDQAKPQTAALTQEVLDGDSNVIAFVNPAPTNGSLPRLDKCSLTLNETSGVHGRYTTQTGCVQREGVVFADAPYWLPGQRGGKVAMCAIEAQNRGTNPWTMETCESNRFLNDRTCGCGVESRRCESSDAVLHGQRIAALNEEPLRIADSVMRRDENYFSVLTTRRSFVNGPLSQLYRNAQSPTTWLATAPSTNAVPDVPIDQLNTWVEYTRDAQHSGVLTTAEWLYRFPTYRSRVNQFYNAFLCKHFSPPPNAVTPAPEDACNRENNLSKRCGCSYCHATVEPVGAHWGRFGERNAQYLPPEKFHKYDARCRDCALAGDTNCNGECGNYVMQAFDGAGAQSLGLLRSYLYRTTDEEANISGGPRMLVERMLQTGDLEACVVKNLWAELLGHPMTDAEQALFLQRLVEDFATKNHNIKDLVLEIVSTEAYRRVD